jgi:hypothetical protein
VKKIILAAILIMPLFHPVHSYATEEELSAECKKMLEETKAEYINLVNNDVLSSFNLLEEMENQNALYFTASDLWKNELLTGKNDVFDSLKKLMVGKYRGEKRLYFFNQNPEEGYILYKDLNNNNIMLTITRDDNQWIVADKQVKEGRNITLETAKCDDQHFMQKMFDNLYP